MVWKVSVGQLYLPAVLFFSMLSMEWDHIGVPIFLETDSPSLHAVQEEEIGFPPFQLNTFFIVLVLTHAIYHFIELNTLIAHNRPGNRSIS